MKVAVVLLRIDMYVYLEFDLILLNFVIYINNEINPKL